MLEGEDLAWAEVLSGLRPGIAPLPPSVQLQAAFVGSTGVEAYKDAKLFWDLIDSDIGPIQGPVLDVGVGWGRLLRWKLRELDQSLMVGLDVDPKMVELCRAALPHAHFFTVSEPPYSMIDSQSVDLAILFSVLSHLSERAALGILHELSRVVRPGGHIVFTTLFPTHVDRWDGDRNLDPWKSILESVDFDARQWWEDAAAGRHLFVPTGGGDLSRPSSFYGEAVIPSGWLPRLALPRLRQKAYLDDTGLPQATIIVERTM